MPQVTYDRFEIGLDHRRDAAVSDANRLQECTNAYITTGRAIRRRPGAVILTNSAGLGTNSRGLISSGGKLCTFGISAVVPGYSEVNYKRLASYGGSTALRWVHFADVIKGFIYVAAEHNDAGHTVRHHYLSGASPFSVVADANCPHGPVCMKGASRIYCAHSDTVPFSAAGTTPADWTTAGDAGFLATGYNAKGSDAATALGNYQGKLVVLGDSWAQVWAMDPDPNLQALIQTVDGVGCLYPQSANNLGGDLFMLSSPGFRSISTLTITDQVVDVDVGAAIDEIVKAKILNDGLVSKPVSCYFPQGGQYICALGGGGAYVYTFSRTSKISAWSYYDFPLLGGYGATADLIEAVTVHKGRLYMRTSSELFYLDETKGRDEYGPAHPQYGEGLAFTTTVKTGYLNFKTPGIMKYVWGFEAEFSGVMSVTVHYRYADDAGVLQTGAVVLGSLGNTNVPGSIFPVEVSAVDVQVEFTVNTDTLWQLDSFTFYYDVLGPMS
jgi:hypothetical protein